MALTRRGQTPATHRWTKAMYWPLTIAALLFLITFTIHVVAHVRGQAAIVTTTIIGLSWLVFIVDYVVRLALSRPRSAWFVTHLDVLAMVVIPALRPVRLLDAFTRVASFRRTKGTSLRAELLIYGIGAALLLMWYVSLGVLQVERDAPGATIVSFGDAVWWAFCTITTVGYGDYAPVTLPGRIFAILLMSGGVVLVGLIVATFSSAVIEQVSHRQHTPSAPHPHVHRASHATVPGSDAAPSAPAPETGPAPR